MIAKIMKIFEEGNDCVSVIVKNETAKEVYRELSRYGVEFREIWDDNYFEELWQEGIILISKNNYKYSCDFFIEPLLNSKGETLQVSSDFVYIDEDLMDAIDRNKVEGIIIAL